MFTMEQARAAMDATVYGSDGNKIGKVGQVYLDDQTDQPEWVTVNTGLFGTSESFIPLEQAQLEGDRLVVPFSKDKVKDAPKVDADSGSLSPAEEEELYRFYGAGAGTTTDTRQTTGVTETTSTLQGGSAPDRDLTGTGRTDDSDTARRDTAGHDTVGHDASGPTIDDAMTRSEERLDVGTRREEVGRARLRKYVVTEQQQVTVPVEREQVRVEREPITDANIGNATDGPAISEEEHEVVLHEERAVVEKETVPVERVRLGTETVTEQQTVTESVRKEQIETDGAEGIDLRRDRVESDRRDTV